MPVQSGRGHRRMLCARFVSVRMPHAASRIGSCCFCGIGSCWVAGSDPIGWGLGSDPKGLRDRTGLVAGRIPWIVAAATTAPGASTGRLRPGFRSFSGRAIFGSIGNFPAGIFDFKAHTATVLEHPAALQTHICSSRGNIWHLNRARGMRELCMLWHGSATALQACPEGP